MNKRCSSLLRSERALAALRSRCRALAVLLAGLVCLAFAAPASAALAGTQAPVAQERGEQAAVVLHDSPRAALQAWLSGITEYKAGHNREAALEQAFSAMELADLGLGRLRHDNGRRAALDLLFVLDRLAELDPARDLPGAGDAALASGRYTLRLAIPDGSGESLAIEFALGADGGWRLAAETVANTTPLWDRVSSLPQIAHQELPNTPVEILRQKIVPQKLQEVVFLLEHWQWLGLALLALLGWVIDRLVRAGTGRLAKRLAGQQRMLLSDELLKRFERPVGLIVGAAVARALLPLLDFEPQYYDAAYVAIGFVLTVASVWAAYRLVDVFSGFLAEKAELTESKFDDVLVPLFRRTLKIVVIVIGVVMISTHFLDEQKLWSVLAGLSIGSLAVGFAARDSIENLFGTFTVLLDKPFELGDWIKLGEVDGVVEDVGFRSTRVRTANDSLLTVPNRRFIGDSLENLGERRWRRTLTTLGLTYDTPPEKLEAFCEGLRELIRRHPYTRKDLYLVYFAAFSASSLDISLTFFLEAQDVGTEQRERERLFLDVLRLARELGVAFAYPSQTVYVAKDQPTHGDSPRDLEAARERGRELAEKVTAHSLGAYQQQRPAPVDFSKPETISLAAGSESRP